MTDASQYAKGGHRLGDSNGSVQIVVFSDYYCPYCRELDSVLTHISPKTQRLVRVTFRHFPLSTRSMKAAKVAECGAQQGVFEQVHRMLFDHVPASSVAAIDDGAIATVVADSAQFIACLSAPATAVRIQEDIAAANKLHIQATPTFLINDRLYAGAATEERLLTLIEQARQ